MQPFFHAKAANTSSGDGSLAHTSIMIGQLQDYAINKELHAGTSDVDHLALHKKKSRDPSIAPHAPNTCKSGNTNTGLERPETRTSDLCHREEVARAGGTCTTYRGCGLLSSVTWIYCFMKMWMKNRYCHVFGTINVYCIVNSGVPCTSRLSYGISMLQKQC